MKILLDTHVYIWWLMQSPRLAPQAIRRIEGADMVYVSAASIWEASIKTGTGKLRADVDDLQRKIALSQFIELPVTARHAVASAKLPLLHKDPFDRILVAQAISEPLRLLTADRRLASYSDLVDLL
jgi:PIN domain nuclease of toxin-antitoxin system